MKIDAVFTWVDGEDPAFLESRRAHADFVAPEPRRRWRDLSGYTGANERWENPQPAEQAKSRFRNLEELRYAMRSIEEYAPWINRIFLVTNGQVPSWLDTSSAKVQVVDHKELFSDESALPTFNSNAIELNLDRIEGLSEHFIYFNDDVFLGRPLLPSDFADELGRPLMFLERGGRLPSDMSDRSRTGHSWAYNHQLVIAGTGLKQLRKMFAHTPQMYTKTLFREIKATWPEEVALTVRHKFRTAFDFVMRVHASHLASNAKWATSRGLPWPLTVRSQLRDRDYIFVRFGEKRSDFSADLSNLLSCRPKFFCINDEIDTGNSEHDEQLKELMASTMQTLFPKPSSYEKTLDGNRAVRSGWRNANEPDLHPTQYGWVRFLGFSDAKGYAVRWRGAGSSSWQYYSEKDHSPEIGLWGGIRVIPTFPPSEKPLVLHFDAIEADAYKHPERAFRRPRRFDVMLTELAESTTFTAKELLDHYTGIEPEVDLVRAIADPILYTPNKWPLSKIFAVDHALRLGDAGERELALLDDALHGKASPFWVAYRRVLCLIQMEEYEQIPEAVRGGVQSRKCPAGTFIRLVKDLLRNDKDQAALKICEGLVFDQKRYPEAIYLRALSRWKLGIEDHDTLALLALPRRSSKVHPGKCFNLWSKVVLGQGMAPETALHLYDQYSLGCKESSELFLARFRIVSRINTGFEARAAFMYALNAKGSPKALTLFAQDEHEAGNVSGARLALELIRSANPDTNPIELPWAAAMVKTGHVNDDVLSILTVKNAEIHDDAQFWSIANIIEPLAGLKQNDLALACFRQLAKAGQSKIKDLIYLLRQVGENQNRELSAEMLQVLKGHYPENGEVLLNWAELQINSGQLGAAVDAALDGALKGDVQLRWVLYHRARLYKARGSLDQFGTSLASQEVGEEDFEVLQDLAQSWISQGDRDAGEALISAVRSSAPPNDLARSTHG